MVLRNGSALFLFCALGAIASARDELVPTGRQYFDAGQYAELEELIREAVNEPIVLSEWQTPVEALYHGLSIGPDATEPEIESYFAKIEEWLDAVPDSQAALAVGINSRTRLAWQARTGGWAFEVEPHQWEGFRHHLELAKNYFDRVQLDKVYDPYLLRTFMTIGLGQGWPRDKMEKVLDRAKTVAPSFIGPISSMAYYLLPRWYGSHGEWARFVRREADAMGGIKGDLLYGYLLATRLRIEDFEIPRREVDFTRARHGMTNHPDQSYRTRHSQYLAMFATVEGDEVAAQQYFLKLYPGDHAGAFGSAENFDDLLNSSGTMDVLSRGAELELNHNWAGALEYYSSPPFSEDPEANPHLRLFLQRQAMKDEYEELYGPVALVGSDLKELRPAPLYEGMLRLATFGEFDEARNFSQAHHHRFGRRNPTGRAILMMLDVLEGDAESARQRVLELGEWPAGRAVYQPAIDYAAGRLTWQEWLDQDPNLQNGMIIQTAFVMIMSMLASGDDDFDAAIDHMLSESNAKSEFRPLLDSFSNGAKRRTLNGSPRSSS